MNAANDSHPPHSPLVGRPARVLPKLAFALGALCVLGLGTIYVIEVRPNQVHRRERERVAGWIYHARTQEPPAGVTKQSWYQYFGPANNALWNVMSRKEAPTEKIRALADELEATKARDLRTVEGLLRLVARMEEISSVARGIGYFDGLRFDLQNDGLYPRDQPAKK